MADRVGLRKAGNPNGFDRLTCPNGAVDLKGAFDAASNQSSSPGQFVATVYERGRHVCDLIASDRLIDVVCPRGRLLARFADRERAIEAVRRKWPAAEEAAP